MFEDRFVEGQEGVGMKILGQFRDARDPNRFVWMRSFPDMASRARALDAFYSGPMWKKDRDAANATMVDASDVLLLKPIDGADTSLAKRMTSLMVATVYLLNAR
jgi:hypothetical protein